LPSPFISALDCCSAVRVTCPLKYCNTSFASRAFTFPSLFTSPKMPLVTLTVHVAFFPFRVVAVIVAVPSFRAVTVPYWSTLAILFELLENFTEISVKTIVRMDIVGFLCKIEESGMELLKERIQKDGRIKGKEILKVDSFLNHQMDIALFEEIGKEFKRRFEDVQVTKLLTIESSGIGIACITARYFKVPVIFAKKNKTKNIAGDVYTSQVESFTHGRVYDIMVAKEFLGKEDKVLLIDDFLANGKALEGLTQIVKESGAELIGAGVVIEKGFQPGGDYLRKKGIRLESLAIIDAMDESSQTITFRRDNE